ncbi:MAG: sigma-54 dependent transcriptional regulator [Thermodesulfovibrionales bacterium]|nr:sigma-54 dependent transcriptional regulator [Thermodesulfovibrionales bacterium]
MKKSILIVEDDPIMRLGMSHFLKSQGYLVFQCNDGREAIQAIEKQRFDLIITDLKLPELDGMEVLKKAKELSKDIGLIIITAYAEIKSAVQAIKEGAYDYLAKPFSNEELLITIERFFKFQNLENELFQLKQTLKEKDGLKNFVGVSPVMMNVFDRITAVAATDVPVLILGESGTGKELVANAVHGMSNRWDKPFIKINCAAIPETLFESELFGHEKGAFTGATEKRKGKFEFANGGTIFFDEIAEIPLSLQPKLLRVLEEQTITRLGSNEPITVDVRCIYATSKNLKELVASGLFREDLYYRINIVPILLPPLRERKEDIPYFIKRFLTFFSEKYGKPNITVSGTSYNALLAYDYPGNVRELKHAIERAVILAENGIIQPKHLPEEITSIVADSPCRKNDMTLDESLRCFEKQKIINALLESDGRKIEAAKKLGISRKVLWKKLKEYNIE